MNILISGANRGIGLGLVKRLALENPSHNIQMACRNLSKGNEAIRKMLEEKVDTHGIHLVNLDLENPSTFENASAYLHQKKSTLDVLVNNAAINLFKDPSNFSPEKADITLTINLYNQIKLIDHFLNSQSVKSGGKIINLTSSVGSLRSIRNENIKKRIQAISSIDDVIKIGEEYVEALKAGEIWQSKNAIVPEYAFGKLLFTIYTELLAKDPRVVENRIQVNSVCPGWVRTEMGGETATLSVEEASEILVSLINKPSGIDADTQGKLFSNKKFAFIR